MSPRRVLETALAAVLRVLRFDVGYVRVWRDYLLFGAVLVGVVYVHVPIVLWIDSGSWSWKGVAVGLAAGCVTGALSLLSPNWRLLLGSAVAFFGLRFTLVALSTANATAGLLAVAQFLVAFLLVRSAPELDWEHDKMPVAARATPWLARSAKAFTAFALASTLLFAGETLLVILGRMQSFYPRQLPPVPLLLSIASAFLSWCSGSWDSLKWSLAAIALWVALFVSLVRVFEG